MNDDTWKLKLYKKYLKTEVQFGWFSVLSVRECHCQIKVLNYTNLTITRADKKEMNGDLRD